MKVYMICEAFSAELPLAVLESIREVANWLSVPYSTASDAIYNHSVVRGAYRVEVVRI